VILTTPVTVCHRKTNASWGQLEQKKIEGCSFKRSENISWGVKLYSWSRELEGDSPFKDR